MGVSLRGDDWRTFSNGRFNIPESTFWPLGIILTGMIVRLAAAFGEYIPAAFAIKRSPFYHNH